MVFLRAAEAEGMSAAACYGGHFPHEIALLDIAVDGKDAVRCRTPLEVVLVINIGSSEKFVVSDGVGSVKSQ